MSGPSKLRRTMKRIYKSIINVNGVIITNDCPECDGDGYSLMDNTNASGGTMIPQICGYCDGYGVIEENDVKLEYDEEGNEYINYKIK
jgi:DnaJ-class molecular chaperone